VTASFRVMYVFVVLKGAWPILGRLHHEYGLEVAA
jgi:hypothetical protein